MSQHTPLVSVVIPTHSRPQFLPRAVESALTCQGDDVEVIVVPNGPDDSWKQSLTRWANDPRVCVSPIVTAHANAARNHGLSIAHGKYIRFLDDDDYLLPAAAKQISALITKGADICSGMVVSVDQDGAMLGRLSSPTSKDFVCAAVLVSGLTLPIGNIFDRNALNRCNWDIQANHGQDHVWMIDLAAVREWNWCQINEEVGVWFQHSQLRTSSIAAFNDKVSQVITHLFHLYDTLVQEERSHPMRNRAIAKALWRGIHKGFPYHPIYWTNIARRALRIDPESGPSLDLYQSGLFHGIHPLFGEWLLLPLRKVTRTYRDAQARFRTTNYRRQL